jgi:hypothetical protein
MTGEAAIASKASGGNLRWWTRTAVIAHSCLAALTLIPSVLNSYTLFVYFLVYRVQTPHGQHLLTMFEPLLHLLVHIVSLFLFIRAYQQARSSLSSDATRLAKKAAIFTALAEMVLVVLLLVSVVWFHSYYSSEVWSHLPSYLLPLEFRSSLMYSVVALSNEAAQFIAFSGYFLLMIVPSLAVLWILKNRGEAMTMVFKVGLIVGAVVVIATFGFWAVFLTLWVQKGVNVELKVLWHELPYQGHYYHLSFYHHTEHGPTASTWMYIPERGSRNNAGGPLSEDEVKRVREIADALVEIESQDQHEGHVAIVIPVQTESGTRIMVFSETDVPGEVRELFKIAELASKRKEVPT